MSDILALVGKAIDTVKKLRDIAEKIKDADTKNLIGDLSMSLADLKMEAAALKEDNLRLHQELAQAKTRNQQSNELIVRDGALYFQSAPAGKPEGPYCINCKENGNRLVFMEDLRGGMWASFGRFRCPQCKGHVH